MAHDVDAALKRMRMSTIRWRVPNICRMTIANLPKIGGVAAAELSGRPLEGATAIIVGAGDSLSRDLPLLRERQGQAAIFTVNTVAPRLYQEGIRPDYLMVMESLPIADQLHRDKVGAVVCDLSAHTDSFSQADYWTLGSSPHNLSILEALGVRPTWSGGAAATAAFSLALNWGADQIIMVGMGLGHTTEEGDEYPDGTAWSGLRYKRHGDRIVYEGREDRDKLHSESGVPPVPRDRPAIEVPAWGGEGTAHTVMELESQRRWFSGYANALDGRARLVNTSLGGARIEAMEERLFEDTEIVGAPGEPLRFMVPPEPARDRLLLECQRARKLCQAIDQPNMDWSVVTELSDGIPFIQGLAAGDFVGMNETHMRPPARLRGIYTIIEAAADYVEKELG